MEIRNGTELEIGKKKSAEFRLLRYETDLAQRGNHMNLCFADNLVDVIAAQG